MANAIITVAMLLVSTALVSYLAFLGRMTSRAVLVLMPAVTMSVASMMLMEVIGHPWLLPIAASGALLGMAMLAVAMALLVLDRRHPGQRQDKPLQGNASYEGSPTHE